MLRRVSHFFTRNPAIIKGLQGRRFFSTVVPKDLPLHRAVKEGQMDEARKLIQSSSERLLTVDHHGYTPLHVAAEHSDYEMLVLNMTGLGARAIRVTKMVTNFGLLAVQLLDLNPHVRKGGMDTFLMCESLLMKKMLLHPKMVVKTYAETEPFYENLQLADKALENLPEIFSGTDPENNFWDADTFEHRQREVGTVRQLYLNQKYPNMKTYFENCVRVVKENKRGNSGEFSEVGTWELIQLGVSSEVFLVMHGRHSHDISVIGRDPNSDIRDYKTWGDKAVVIDWQEKICFPAKDIPFYLNAYWRFENSDSYIGKKNIRPEFNPHFHQFIRKYEFKVAKPGDYEITAHEVMNMILKTPVRLGF